MPEPVAELAPGGLKSYFPRCSCGASEMDDEARPADIVGKPQHLPPC
jgi:hypothetical protein